MRCSPAVRCISPAENRTKTPPASGRGRRGRFQEGGTGVELIRPDKDACVKCGACAEICPMRVIQIDGEGYPRPIHDAFKICINCGYCVDVCVPGALHHQVRRRSMNPDAALRRLKRIRENRRKRKEGSP